MAIALVGTPLTFAFNDGNAGHACSLGSAPNVGETDVLCVNSNTVVSTPAGFTAAATAVTNQGAYVFTRLASGGESSSVTITTSDNHNTTVVHSRWSGSDGFDAAIDDDTQANGASGNTTPAHDTGALAESGCAVVAFGALHSIGTANQNTPVWSSGYTALAAGAVQGSGPTGTVAYGGYKLGAGTAAEQPQVSWSGDGCQNRYMLTVVLQAAAGQSAAVGTATETDAAQAFGRAKARTVGVAAETDTALPAGRAKARTVGTATSTEVALPIGRGKSRALGTATETDTALPIANSSTAAVRATSAATVAARRTATTAVTARRTSTSTVGG